MCYCNYHGKRKPNAVEDPLVVPMDRHIDGEEQATLTYIIIIIIYNQETHQIYYWLDKVNTRIFGCRTCEVLSIHRLTRHRVDVSFFTRKIAKIQLNSTQLNNNYNSKRFCRQI